MATVEHTVEKGEDLYHIGVRYGLNWRFIGQFNNLENGNVVHEGQKIMIPHSTKGLSDLVDVLNTWLETRDRTVDVTPLAVQLETFSRKSNFTREELHSWLGTVQLLPAEDIIWEFHHAKKLATLSWFIGEFAGEWRKYLNADTK
jgi:LysM repeat protein